MDAIYCGPNGKAWKDSRFTIYGWIEPGGNISTSNLGFNKLSGTGGNYPAAYSYQPNTIQLDQAALYFERTPDEIQRDHFDWGFRVATALRHGLQVHVLERHPELSVHPAGTALRL